MEMSARQVAIHKRRKLALFRGKTARTAIRADIVNIDYPSLGNRHRVLHKPVWLYRQ